MAAKKPEGAPKKKPTRKAAAPSADAPTAPTAPARPAAAKKAPRKAAAKPAPDAEAKPAKGPVEKTRIVFPKDYYEPHKDAIKAPFKAHSMKWNYLGEGKGLYKRDKDVHCFAQFMDDGTHYSLWGDDKAAVAAILDAWRALAGDAAFARFSGAGVAAAAEEVAQKESEALRLWRLGEPQPRPGEPEFFFKKRKADWLAAKPES